MNYFNNIAAGMELYHDDWRFVQDYLIEGIQAIFKALEVDTNQNFIVYGANVTDNGDGTLTISEGYVWLNGELLHVPEHTVSVQSTGLFVYQKNTYDLPGGERDANGIVFNPWQINEAKAVEVSTILATDLLIYGRRLNEQFYNFLKSYNPQNEWKIVGNDGGLTALDSNFAQTELPLSWRITPDYTLQVTGRVIIANNLTAGTKYVVTDFKNVGKFIRTFDFYDSYYIKQGEDEFGKFGWAIVRGQDVEGIWYPRLYFEPFADISQGVVWFNCQIPVLPLN